APGGRAAGLVPAAHADGRGVRAGHHRHPALPAVPHRGHPDHARPGGRQRAERRPPAARVGAGADWRADPRGPGRQRREKAEGGAMPGRLRFELLGPVRAARGDDVLELGSPQQCATLAVLLLNEGRQVSSADLVGALWSGEPPRSATGVVRTYVSRLRRVLDGVIESAGDGYALPPRDAVLDADHFQRLVAAAQQARQRADVAEVAALLHSALDLWRGEPMSGLRTPYFDAHRSRLVELKWTAIEDRLAADLELGRHAETVAELRSLVARHPTRERLHELLMLALYKCGRQGEALAAFQDARQRLAEQLGIEPGLALRRAHRLLVDVGQVSAGTPGKAVPNQLPPDVAEF